ncbi:MAG TPA: bifunctional (p)ppGpp synthetase/guanosine-3',5'-bis(diphosphate) 3'-pyrophosphohydrolase [Deferrisomatales bacterium]|nr:bifunctional (p)ppGpp synthetase/guanosine-3',5'-bis(diphosphate) 3'-pyrophosphohydrolase [Deferrisomatales bacterium]
MPHPECEALVARVLAYQPEARVELLQRACAFATEPPEGQAAPSASRREHAVAVAAVLAELYMDDLTVVCGLLHHRVAEEPDARATVVGQFGPEVVELLDGLAKISRVTYSSSKSEQAESFRRLILAMAQDVRVVVIRLAHRLHEMRSPHPVEPGLRERMGREALDIYAPLANRLGIHRLKSELEDLGLAWSLPEVYADLVARSQERVAESEVYIHGVRNILEQILADNGIRGRVSGRPKHLYSIYRKMLDQGIGFDKVYDFIAFRIIVDELRDCYAMLGVIHGRWTPVPGRFKDYVALPKRNLYQSLHTTVIGPRGQPIEVQIRTEKMHRIAEQGIAAHWRYKEKRDTPRPEDRVFEWLRQVVDAHQEIRDPQEFLEAIKVELYPDVVFVFSPAGDLMEFPQGSTPVDFAYAVHTQVGERCVGAKVNDRMVPLSYRLKNGDRIEIITAKSHTPSADWLEFVQTTKARSKVRQWIKAQQRERSMELGRELCDREFRKAGHSFSKAWKEAGMQAVAQQFGFTRPEEILESVGYGKLTSRQVLGKVYPTHEEQSDREVEEPKRARRAEGPRRGIVIRGVGDTMVRFARCCNPLPGEAVMGFVTRGQGLTVHTADCVNMRRLDPARRIEVEWGGAEATSHPVKIRVYCDDRKGILATVTQILAGFDVNVSRADVRTSAAGHAELNFEILVENLDRLQKILGSIRNIKGVARVVRVKR